MVTKRKPFILGQRGWLLLLCAVIWSLMGIGVLEGISGDNKEAFHTLFPVPLRVGGWLIPAGVAVYAALTKRLAPTAGGLLFVMPLLRVCSYTWAWLMSLIPGIPEGYPTAWYSAVFHLVMVAIVILAMRTKDIGSISRGD